MKISYHDEARYICRVANDKDRILIDRINRIHEMIKIMIRNAIKEREKEMDKEWEEAARLTEEIKQVLTKILGK